MPFIECYFIVFFGKYQKIGGYFEFMAKKKDYFNISDIMQLAKDCNVENNPLFIQSVNNYATIQKAIEKIDIELSDDNSIIVTKEYVKSRENIYINPCIKELPKLIDAANKTTANMVNIIKTFGNCEPKNELLDWLYEHGSL